MELKKNVCSLNGCTNYYPKMECVNSYCIINMLTAKLYLKWRQNLWILCSGRGLYGLKRIILVGGIFEVGDVTTCNFERIFG
jgi:hypothetical protein